MGWLQGEFHHMASFKFNKTRRARHQSADGVLSVERTKICGTLLTQKYHQSFENTQLQNELTNANATARKLGPIA